MRVVVLGGTGHIGSYLVPMLVEAGHEVTCVSRRMSLPYTPNMRHFSEEITKKGVELRPLPSGEIEDGRYAAIWRGVRRIAVDRRKLEGEQSFGRFVSDLKPDVVCDLICYDAGQADQMLEAGAGRDWQLISAGTVWVFDAKVYAPVDEAHPRTGTGFYGTNKIAMEARLLEAARAGAPAISVVHPGHVVGRGWIPINPQGNFNVEVYRAAARGETLVLPGPGDRTLQPVHARDVAGTILACMASPDRAAGQAFLSTCPRAIAQYDFARAVFSYFGREPNIAFEESYERFLGGLEEKDRIQSDEHLSRSPDATCRKAAELLGYAPEFSAEEAVFDSLDALIQMQYI